MPSKAKRGRKKVMPLLLNKELEDPRVEHKLLQKLDRLQKDYSWISSNNKKLRTSHLNQFIAVKNQKIVFEDKDFKALLKKIKSSRSKIDEYAIEYVRKHPICLLL